MNRQERLKQIHLYRTGQMFGIERELFEQQLDEDEKLKLDYHMILELKEVIDKKSPYNTFQKIVEDISGDYFSPQQKVTKLNLWHMAAAVALLVTTSTLWFFFWNSSPEDYFAENFVHRPATLSFKSDPFDFSADESLSKAMFIYEAKNYEGAIPYFIEALEEDSTNEMTMLYLGISYAGHLEFKKSDSILSRISDSSAYQEARDYYLSLIYLSDDDKENDEEGENLIE